MARFFGRNPFARTENKSERVYVGSQTCSWCGQVKTTPKGRRYLFRYSVTSDGGRTSVLKGLFCCASCKNSYHS